MSGRDDRIRELYEAALERPIGERAAFVAAHSGRDEDLKLRVNALLAGQQDTELPGYEGVSGASLLTAGTEIGHYRIDGPLGAGGMGVVYRATDLKLNRPAAIKVLPESLADPEARRRFQREAQTASSLNHPHIVTVHDAGEYEGRQYLITEYVDGGTLRHWAARPRGWRAIVELLVGVADAVAVAHEAGILHRDIKPENILLAKNGYAKLADFGLAKLLESDPLADDAFVGLRPDAQSSLVGTAAYMSPEQAQGLPLDGRSDVYSFGLVLHELLSGQRPDAVRALEQRHGGAPAAFAPLGEGVPAELRALVVKALERERADRYQTMRELVVDLRRLVRRPDDAGAAASVAVPRANARRIAIAAAVLVVLAIGVASVFNLWRDGSGPGPVRVAILPFEDESLREADDVPLSEALADLLREDLGPLPGVSVVARASSVALAGQGLDLRTVADRLDVGIIVTGTVLRRSGDSLSVAVEIVDGATGAVDFARRYDGSLPSVQQQLVGDVSAHLSPSEAVPALAATTRVAAARALAFGRHLFREVRDAQLVDEAKLNRAIDYYRTAVAEDPQSEAALSGLAAALLYRGDLDAALPELEKALAIGRRAETFHTLATYAQTAGPDAAQYIEAAFEKAIALNDDDADVVGDYAVWRFVHRDPATAEPLFEHALENDPYLLSRYTRYIEFLGSFERQDRLQELIALLKERFPNARGYRALARAYELLGELDVGIGWALTALATQPDEDTRLQIAELYARIGDFEAARRYEPEPVGLNQLYFARRYPELLEAAEEEYFDDPGTWYFLAFAYHVAGEFAAAGNLLENVGGLPESALIDSYGAVETQSLVVWADAQIALGFADKTQSVLEEYIDDMRRSSSSAFTTTGWWNNIFVACALADLGRTEEALATLEEVKSDMGLPWRPLLEDSRCFARFRDEPRYRDVVQNVHHRQEMLRERLPDTLRGQFPDLEPI